MTEDKIALLDAINLAHSEVLIAMLKQLSPASRDIVMADALSQIRNRSSERLLLPEERAKLYAIRDAAAELAHKIALNAQD